MSDRPEIPGGLNPLRCAYVETSAVSYATAEGRAADVVLSRRASTRAWLRSTAFTPVVSDDVVSECRDGDAAEAAKRLLVMADWPVLPPHPTVDEVADDLLRSRLVPETQPLDARHIAFAACYRTAVLASLNFKHIVNTRLVGRIEARLRDDWGLPLKIATPEAIMLLETSDE